MAYPTPLLDARLAREKKRNEENRQQLLNETIAWLTHNSSKYGVSKGYIFGSVTVPGKFTARSDIDIAVETHKTGDICALMGDLSMQIMKDVDVVPLDQCHFAAKIRREGIRWSAIASPD